MIKLTTRYHEICSQVNDIFERKLKLKVSNGLQSGFLENADKPISCELTKTEVSEYYYAAIGVKIDFFKETLTAQAELHVAAE